MGVSNTSDYIQIKIKMANTSQDPPASFKAPNQDWKDMDVLCFFNIKIESQSPDHRCTKDQWLWTNQDPDAKPQLGTSSVLQSPKENLNDMDFLCTFRFKIESKIRNMSVSKTSDHIQIKKKIQTQN